jgi:hypothetical protein
MKNTKINVGSFTLVILAASLVLTMTVAGCGGGGGGGGSPTPESATYTYNDDAGNAYKLEITQAGRAAFIPKKGDNYVLTITFVNGDVKKSTGTITGFSNNQLELKSSDNKVFCVIVNGGKIDGITGDIPVSLPEGKQVVITDFKNWKETVKGETNYWKSIGVFLIADPDNVYSDDFPVVDALQYSDVLANENTYPVLFKLVIPRDNTWNGGIPWSGTGEYYVVIVPCIPPYFYSDYAKIYKNDATPAKVSFDDDKVELDFSKFKDTH